MGVAADGVRQRPLDGSLGNDGLVDRHLPRHRGLVCEDERGDAGSRIATGRTHERGGGLRIKLGRQVLGGTPDHRPQRLVIEGAELEQRTAGQEGCVQLGVRVLGRRADQRQDARLHGRQQCILLGLVEPVDLVEKQDRASPCLPEPVAGVGDARHDVGLAGGDC